LQNERPYQRRFERTPQESETREKSEKHTKRELELEVLKSNLEIQNEIKERQVPEY